MLVWWSRDREGQRGKPCEFSGADSSCVLFPRGGGGGISIKKWRDWSREKEHKDVLWSTSFPGFTRMAADGLSTEDWISESSCSQVLVLTAGVIGPLCTGCMLEINGFHCARMHTLSCPG